MSEKGRPGSTWDALLFPNQRRGRDSKTGEGVEQRVEAVRSVEEASTEACASTQSDVAGPKVDRAVVHLDRADDVARLTRAIELAANAGEWQVVKMLGGQLEALTRAAAGNVVELSTTRRGRC